MNTTEQETTAVIYSRVSTDRQCAERQINELKSFAESRHGYDVKRIFQETISGAKGKAERPALSGMIEYCIKNEIKHILVSDISRLGRNTKDVLETIDLMNKAGINIFIHDQNINTLKPDGTANEITALLLSILSSIATWERRMIRERMKSGYDNWRKSAKTLGRPKGTGKKDNDFLAEYSHVLKELKKGESIDRAAKLSGVHRNTALKVYRKAVGAGILKRRPRLGSKEWHEAKKIEAQRKSKASI